jgi:Flp pilus assembly protein TadG
MILSNRLIQGRRRRGKAVVEFAFVAPLLFLLIFGMIEFGRVVMVMQILTNAVREGGRLAAVSATSNTDIENVVRGYLTNSGVNSTAIQNVTVTDGGGAAINYGTVTDGTQMRISCTLLTSRVTWLPMQWILPAGHQLSATSVMRRE